MNKRKSISVSETSLGKMGSESLVEIVDNIVKSKLKYEEKYNSVIELLFDVLRENGTRIVLVDNDTGRQWTASELQDAIVTLGVKFSEYGVSNGDSVAFFGPNSDFHIIALLSVWAIGAIYTGLIHRGSLSELNNVITKTNAIYLVGSKETIDICNDFLSSNNTIKKFFLIDESSDRNIPSIHSLIKCKIENGEEKFMALMSKVKSSDLCKISFSSGTTGEPKPVTERQERYISYKRFTAPEIGVLTNRDTCALLQPLAHVGGSMLLCFIMVNRASVVVFSRFVCDDFVRDFKKHGITFACIVPSYITILNRTISEPLKSFCLKKVISAGELAHEIICKEFIEKFKPEYFAQGLATTEAGWTTIVPVSEGINNLKSIGVPTPGFQIKIVDTETGEILGANKFGEMCMKGPETTKGYLNNETATQESFDEQFFFKSGDIGYFDEKGYIYVVDRIKEVIKYNNQQVSPTELQCFLLQHESVKEAAVVGIPDNDYGELPKAFVVLKQEFKDKVQENELLEFVNARVMDFKKLRGGLTLISELPKTSFGKIDRRKLKSISVEMKI